MSETNSDLTSMYPLPSDHVLSIGDIDYHSSLTPIWEELKKVKKITFKTTLFDRVPQYLVRMRTQNSINNHLFKPKYFRNGKADELYCEVASNDVLVHTMRSLAIVFKHLNHSSAIDVCITNEVSDYSSICAHWGISDRVFIGRVESVLFYLRAIWLLENTEMPWEKIESMLLAVETARLKDFDPNYLDSIEKFYLESFGLTFVFIDTQLQVESLDSDSAYVRAINVVYRGEKISIVQLQWGVELTTQQFKALLLLNPNISKIGIVGGVGYMGKEDVSVDDIFVPTSVVLKEDELTHVVSSINNNALNLAPNRYFSKKTEYSGTLKTIIPKMGVLSYSAQCKTDNHPSFHAVDMEKEAFITELRKSLPIEWASMYYIMDIPSKGIGLGDTYYNSSFLTELLNNPNRGKYYCFEKIIGFLVN